jgi:hypothetical protein
LLALSLIEFEHEWGIELGEDSVLLGQLEGLENHRYLTSSTWQVAVFPFLHKLWPLLNDARAHFGLGVKPVHDEVEQLWCQHLGERVGAEHVNVHVVTEILIKHLPLLLGYLLIGSVSLLECVGDHLIDDSLDPLLVDVLGDIQPLLDPLLHSTLMPRHRLIDERVVLHVVVGRLYEYGAIHALKARHEEVWYLLAIRFDRYNVVWELPTWC